MKNILLALSIMLVSLVGAQASPRCPTHAEAVAQYGTHVWLYWHTKERCWDNHRRNVMQWPLSKKDAEASQQPEPAALHKVSEPQPRYSIWPDVPTEISFSYRWPDQDPPPRPSRYLNELIEFGWQT